MFFQLRGGHGCSEFGDIFMAQPITWNMEIPEAQDQLGLETVEETKIKHDKALVYICTCLYIYMLYARTCVCVCVCEFATGIPRVFPCFNVTQPRNVDARRCMFVLNPASIHAHGFNERAGRRVCIHVW